MTMKLQTEQRYQDWVAAKGSLAHALHDELKERVDLSSFCTHLWTFEELVAGALSDHELSTAVISLAAAIMNLKKEGSRHYYVTDDCVIDYHDERIQDPAEADAAVAPPVSAYVAQFGGFIDSILRNDDSSSNDEGSK